MRAERHPPFGVPPAGGGHPSYFLSVGCSDSAGVDAAGIVAAASTTLTATGPAGPAASVRPDYVVVTDIELGPAPTTGSARLLVAAHVGRVRLLDNTAIELAPAAAAAAAVAGREGTLR